MRRKADAPFRRLQVERLAHAAREERIEACLQRPDTVIEAAKDCGWTCFYIPDSARSGAVGRPKGWPDLTLCHTGMNILVFAELKTDNPRSQPSDEQRKWLTVLHDCGEAVQLRRPSMWSHIETVLKGPAAITWNALNNSDEGSWWG